MLCVRTSTLCTEKTIFMKIKISTLVNRSRDEVWEKFDENLFLALKPPLVPLELLQFDGCETGDTVKLRTGFSPFRQEWHAAIIEHAILESETYFIDIGTKLPFPLREWKHKHRIVDSDDNTMIIDDIYYSTKLLPLDLLIWPLLYFMFYLRKPVYRKFFS